MNLDARFSNGLADYIRLRKVGEVEAPDCKSGEWTTYPVGTSDMTDVSLPVGYELEGWLLTKPVVGGRVEVLRAYRNGVARLGYYTSSVVVEIADDGFRTRNSIYSLTILPTIREE